MFLGCPAGSLGSRLSKANLIPGPSALHQQADDLKQDDLLICIIKTMGGAASARG